MGNQIEIVQKWIDTYGIHSVLDAESPDSPTPAFAGWDLKKVWTCWDSYDQMGSFVTPGFSEKEEVEGELFVSAWYLGTQTAELSAENVTVMDREACEECYTEGCESCDELGWIETFYIEGTNIKPLVLSAEAQQSPKLAKYCSNCGEVLSGPGQASR